jgi:molybdopterin molybdotransferase
MLSIADALQLLNSHSPPPQTESIPLLAALNRVLAANIAVPEPYPAFNRSTMDGYALQSNSAKTTSQTPNSADNTITCRVVATITAGQTHSQTVASHECVRIMTGALLPHDCDCVIPQELAKIPDDQSNHVILPRAACRPGACVIATGSLGMPGDPLINKGTKLQPRHIAALAEFGITHATVTAIPTVAIISTGNELVPFHQTPPQGQLRNSSQPMLATLLQHMGARILSLQSATDSPANLDSAIHNALAADILLLTGGVSVGILDLVPAALARAQVTQLFHGVRLKPGKPLWAGIRQTSTHSTLVFGLPGNPVSSLACCELFVRPAVRRLLGLKPTPQLTAILTQDTLVKGDRPVCQPAIASIQNSQLVAHPVPWQLSADLRSTAAANAMILLDPSLTPHTAGSAVSVWLWDGLPED